MTELLDLSVPELATLVSAGDVSAVEVTEHSLQAIDASKPLNAYLHVSAEAALESAKTLDARRSRGEALGPLAGVPIAIKDALCTRDAPTSCASRILTRDGSLGSAWRPPYDATVVERLRQAGAVLVGKTNMDEFAMGSSNENSAFGPVRNPWDPSRVPGGSSGGSAVAVAARTALSALGSDTGGSIRQPGAHCGVVGVKPSYGRVSRYGLVAFASSLDQVGPFTRDVRSAARVLEVIAGADARDSTCAPVAVGQYEAACSRDAKGLRIGVPEEYFAEGLDPQVKACVDGVVSSLEKAGLSVRPVRLPHTRFGVATYYIIATAEASSNLARFDGVRFGLRVEPPGADLQQLYGATRNQGFGPEVKRRILLGTYVLSAGYYEAYYRKAQKVRTLLRQDFDRVFEGVDALVAPTAPSPAFRLGERTADPLSMYLADVYTLPASLAGVCAISVPCGTTAPDGDRPALPVGVQFIAPAFCEERLFQLAANYETLSPVSKLVAPRVPA